MTDTKQPDRLIPDEELIARARASGGDPGNLEHLLGRHRASIFRRCLAIIGDPDDAEDVTQDVLVRIFRGLDGYEGRSRFRTWLHTIVQHECWTFTARRGRQRLSEEVRSKIKIHFSPEHQHITGALSARQLHHVLARMPDSAREILQLHYLRELSLPQIAPLLGMSLSAAKMRLYRALSSSQKLVKLVVIRSRGENAEHPRQHFRQPQSVGKHYATGGFADTGESSRSAQRRYT